MPETDKVLKLKEMIQYQQGSVVSREILTPESGTVTLFAFDEGQGLSEHSAPYEALVLILDGEAEISIDRKPHRVRQGEMIIMPASHPHALKAVGRFKMLLILMKP